MADAIKEGHVITYVFQTRLMSALFACRTVLVTKRHLQYGQAPDKCVLPDLCQPIHCADVPCPPAEQQEASHERQHCMRGHPSSMMLPAGEPALLLHGAPVCWA